jgi:6-phosphogluconolactonase
VTGSRREMQTELLAGSHAVAEAAAELIAAEARRCSAERGRFVLAVSGGRTPAVMLRVLADLAVPWDSVHIFQVDERVAPLGDPARNLTQLHECLLAHVPLRPGQVHAMPVEQADLDSAARGYADVLRAFAGTPPVLDLVHLGLGVDGHTASLVPGDPSLDTLDEEVALAGPYQGHRRMTLTLPALDRARRVLWVVTGEEKSAMLRRLQAGDRTIPAGRVQQERAMLIADRAAALLPKNRCQAPIVR